MKTKMKTTLLVAAIIVCSNSFAQSNKIKLNNGQTITITSTATQSMNMSMGMEVNSVTNSTHSLKVNSETKNDYNISATLTKIKTTSSAMGQEMKYDSENPADSSSEMAGVFSESLNVTNNYLLQKAEGTVKLENPEKADNAKTEKADPLEALSVASISADNSSIVAGAVFPKLIGKKVGDTWVDSSTVNGLKNISNFTYEALQNGIAQIKLNATLTGTQQTEAQGMTMDIDMNTKSTGSIEVDTKTLLVKKRTVEATINAKMDMMGQTMDMTGTAQTVINYN